MPLADANPSKPLPDQVDALVGAVMPPPPPVAASGPPIPAPLALPSSRSSGRRVKCPNCDRTWPWRQTARYELHWRLNHDVRASDEVENDFRDDDPAETDAR